ncbi:YceD family protein [Arcanobacterium canis]
MDLKSPFVISIVDLPRQEGAIRQMRRSFDAPADVGVQMYSVEEGSELDVDFTLQSVSEGVLIDGYVNAHAHGQCSRCLIDIDDDMNERISELVFYPERAAVLEDEGDEEAEDFFLIESERIDLEPIIRDSLVLAMPLQPLCQPDCEGLCPVCGERWLDLPIDHEHPEESSDFSVLDALAAKLRAEEEGR